MLYYIKQCLNFIFDQLLYIKNGKKNRGDINLEDESLHPKWFPILWGFFVLFLFFWGGWGGFVNNKRWTITRSRLHRHRHALVIRLSVSTSQHNSENKQQDDHSPWRPSQRLHLPVLQWLPRFPLGSHLCAHARTVSSSSRHPVWRSYEN